jgi:hypothetical protein
VPRYTEVGSGETENGNPWRVGLVRGRLVVMWDRLTMTPADQEAFAEAVARAVTPGQVTQGGTCPAVFTPDEGDACACDQPEGHVPAGEHHCPACGTWWTFTADGAIAGQLTVRVFPCCKHCERERELTGAGPCVPPGHLARCTNGCDDTATPGQVSGG